MWASDRTQICRMDAVAMGMQMCRAVVGRNMGEVVTSNDVAQKLPVPSFT